jgi:hypothetical protein
VEQQVRERASSDGDAELVAVGEVYGGLSPGLCLRMSPIVITCFGAS